MLLFVLILNMLNKMNLDFLRHFKEIRFDFNSSLFYKAESIYFDSVKLSLVDSNQIQISRDHNLLL